MTESLWRCHGHAVHSRRVDLRLKQHSSNSSNSSNIRQQQSNSRDNNEKDDDDDDDYHHRRQQLSDDTATATQHGHETRLMPCSAAA